MIGRMAIMTGWWGIVLFPAADAILCGAEPTDQEAIRVIPVRITVTRIRYLSETPAIKATPTMNVQLRFRGKPIAKVSRAGRLKIEQAQDDTGRDLNRHSSVFLWKNLRPVSSINLKDDAGGAFYDHTLYFDVPDRTAKKLAVLKGEITFTLSESARVTLSAGQLMELVGKPLTDPLLKKKQLKVVIERYTPRSGSVRVRVSGPEKAHESFLRLSLQDANGKVVKTDRPFQGFTYASASLTFFKPIPADHKIVLDFETSRKEVTVPFHLTDIPLP